MKKISSGDTLILDSIKILGNTTEDAFNMYKSLVERNINLKFCAQPHLDSEIFDSPEVLKVAEKQIKLVFSKHASNISSGMATTKKHIGRYEHGIYETEKAKKYKKIIESESRTFDGDKTDRELLGQIQLSKSTFYKYKNEIKGARTTIDHFERENRFLSNFAPCTIEYEGLTYPSTEAAYQAAKCKNDEERVRFTHLSPAEAKREGNKVDLKENWEDIKVDVMRDLIHIKFSQPEFRNKLLSTGDKILIEGTGGPKFKNDWHDNFWGACSCPHCFGKEKHNWLGRLLMKKREELRNG